MGAIAKQSDRSFRVGAVFGAVIGAFLTLILLWQPISLRDEIIAENHKLMLVYSKKCRVTNLQP